MFKSPSIRQRTWFFLEWVGVGASWSSPLQDDICSVNVCACCWVVGVLLTENMERVSWLKRSTYLPAKIQVHRCAGTRGAKEDELQVWPVLVALANWGYLKMAGLVAHDLKLQKVYLLVYQREVRWGTRRKSDFDVGTCPEDKVMVWATSNDLKATCDRTICVPLWITGVKMSVSCYWCGVWLGNCVETRCRLSGGGCWYSRSKDHKVCMGSQCRACAVGLLTVTCERGIWIYQKTPKVIGLSVTVVGVAVVVMISDAAFSSCGWNAEKWIWESNGKLY